VRYKTAAILSLVLIVLIGGMFALPAAVAVFLPSLKPGIPDPVPVYEGILLGAAFFCLRWHWLLVPLVLPTVVLLFIVAAFTSRRTSVRR
jgi:cytochrome c biogenesis factor